MSDSPIDPRQKTEGRDAAGRFTRGNRASPGRPPGRSQATLLRERLATDLDQILDNLLVQARAGDLQAVRLVLDRVLPSLRPVEVPADIDLPAGGLAVQAAAVVQACAAGDLAPGQAAQLVAALSGVGKIIETTELIARIEALEGAASARKG
jgi:hypothetical protein